MNRRVARALMAVALLVGAAHPASATKYAGEFLRIPVGARAMGMGGAFVAVADDATSLYWNPAGMVYLPYREAFLQHAEQFGSLVNHDFGAVVLPMKAEGDRRAAFGVSGIWVACRTSRSRRVQAVCSRATGSTTAPTTTRPPPATARTMATGTRASECC